MSDVVFRRIKGHIVPIKIKREKAEGAGMVAAGLGVAAASGTVASRLVMGAAHAENQARKVVSAARKARNTMQASGPLFAAAANKEYLRAGHEALKTMTESRKLFDASLRVRNAGYTAGAALIAGGIHRAMSQDGKKSNPKVTAAVSAGAGIAAHFAVRSSFVRSIGSKKTFDAMKAAAKTIIVKRFVK
jgi:hypothetical protein